MTRFSSLLAPALPLVAVSCAPWIWNQRYIECDDIQRLGLANSYSATHLRIGAYEAGRDDSECEIVASGLRGASVDAGSEDLVLYDLPRVNVRVPDGVLRLSQGLTAYWGYQEDDSGPPAWVENPPQWSTSTDAELAIVDIERVVMDDDTAIDSVHIEANQDGYVRLSPERAEILCGECRVFGALRHDEVRVGINEPSGDVHLCIDAEDDVSVVVRSQQPLGDIRLHLEFLQVPQRSEFIWDAGEETDVVVSLPLGADLQDFGTPPPNGVEGPTTVISDNRCDVGVHTP